MTYPSWHLQNSWGRSPVGSPCARYAPSSSTNTNFLKSSAKAHRVHSGLLEEISENFPILRDQNPCSIADTAANSGQDRWTPHQFECHPYQSGDIGKSQEIWQKSKCLLVELDGQKKTTPQQDEGLIWPMLQNSMLHGIFCASFPGIWPRSKLHVCHVSGWLQMAAVHAWAVSFTQKSICQIPIMDLKMRYTSFSICMGNLLCLTDASSSTLIDTREHWRDWKDSSEVSRASSTPFRTISRHPNMCSRSPLGPTQATKPPQNFRKHKMTAKRYKHPKIEERKWPFCKKYPKILDTPLQWLNDSSMKHWSSGDFQPGRPG